MKLWVDDERPAPEGWTGVKTSNAAILLIAIYGNKENGDLTEISLDHDLGGDDTTRSVVSWMAEHDVWPRVVRVHTQNPVGRDWLVGMVERYGPGVTR